MLQKIEILKKFNISEEKIKKLLDFEQEFLRENSKLNLVSKNEENVLFEKHIFDSLSILNVLFNQEGELLDIGTGGGFPALVIAIIYENMKIYPIDSIGKKIRAVENIKENLDLKNVYPICDRVENIDKMFDFVTSRAVASLKKILPLAIKKLKKNGKFIAYKSRKVEEEIKEAMPIIKKYGLKMPQTYRYELPTEEKHERYLVIFEK